MGGLLRNPPMDGFRHAHHAHSPLLGLVEQLGLVNCSREKLHEILASDLNPLRNSTNLFCAEIDSVVERISSVKHCRVTSLLYCNA